MYKYYICKHKIWKNGYVRNFQENNNIIQILIELIDNSEIDKSLSNEYDSLCKETQYAYGIVSLIYKYGMKIKWEILQRTIASKYNFTWEDFVYKILNSDAKGNLYDDEIQGNYYILGRNRYICEKIVQIHFGGNYSEEILAFKELILTCCGLEKDEHFVGGLINAILRDDKLYYSREQILDLLDFAIDNFENESNSAFITHIKGEYYLTLRDYHSAIRCFDSNVQNGLNEVYSLHSLGKTYFYLAQRENSQSGEARMHLDLAIDKLSKKNKISHDEMIKIAHKNIDENTLNSLLNERSNKLVVE